MRVLIVSDIHSNLEAFQRVVEDANRRGGFDEVWSLGDLVGYGPDPAACIEMLRQFDGPSVAGNHDLGCISRLSIEAFNTHAAAANRWTATQITDDQAGYLRALPLRLQRDGFTIVHGSPRDPIWEYVVSASAAEASFLQFETPRCLVGHSHIPFICRPVEDGVRFLDFPLDTPVALGSDRMIVNPGSVGQPRDGDPRASYAVYDGDASVIFRHRVEYDIAATQAKMRERDLPRYLIERLSYGR